MDLNFYCWLVFKMVCRQVDTVYLIIKTSGGMVAKS